MGRAGVGVPRWVDGLSDAWRAHTGFSQLCSACVRVSVGGDGAETLVAPIAVE